MHQIITGSAARHNSGVRHNFRADCSIFCLPFGIDMLYKGTASEIVYVYLASTV